jgi:DNA-binding beta-propeller fold protein YncE
MNKLAFVAAGALAVFTATAAQASAVAPFGSQLATLIPDHTGNGRALAFDPKSGHLFYTNAGDDHIYVVDTSGADVATLTTAYNYGSLSWDSKHAVLWGGRYDGSGAIDTVDPMTGASTPQFAFAFPLGDSCYAQAPGFTDGLAFDRITETLWLSDDNARHVFHVTLTGTELSNFLVPDGKCNTGIASIGQFLWLARQSGPDTAPYDVARVAKSDPTTVISSFAFDHGVGPEGIAVDKDTFVPNCTVWTNQFGTTTLTAWAVEPGCPANS